ncbi:MAG: D-alanine--D-alanine ligase [Gammaproteobacteria bacterium]|nr:D-alanine--D-alanine ligase [Gammaproteobacteria bacterium]
MSSSSDNRIVILHEAVAENARPDEFDLLVQVEEVTASLERLGWDVHTLAVDLDFAKTLTALRDFGAVCVFNLVESLGGCGQLITVVPSLLSAAGLRFTGSDADAIYLSSQKTLAKRWMALHGIATPSWIGSGDEIGANSQRWIVKSVWEHASLGLDDDAVVRGKRAVSDRLEKCRSGFGGEWFAERFIDGREFNVSVIEESGEPYILPIAEIRFEDYAPGKPHIVGYAAKWVSESHEYHNTPRHFPKLSPQQDARIRDVVKRCWRLFRLSGYARVDIRLDGRGVPWVLEINANPCLSRDAGFVAAANEAGIVYDRAIELILDAANETSVRPAETAR